MDRHFYHSFPRIRPGDERAKTLADGMAILRSIFESGLILAPEIVTWKQPLLDGTYREIKNRQVRISFTELTEHDLLEHSKFFGPFSIEFEIETLRKVGALPVIYMPQHLEDKTISSVGTTIVSQMHDIKHTISLLHNLSQYTTLEYWQKQDPNIKEISPDCVFTLQNLSPDGQIVQPFQVSLKTIDDILKFIGYRNAPFEIMMGVLSAAQSLFYPTDDQIHNELLKYYRQREWRLISGITVAGKAQSRLLQEKERERIVSINKDFWLREMSDGQTSIRRIDEAVIIEAFEGKPISSIISCVRVPAEVFEDCKKIYGDIVKLQDE